MAIKLQDQTAPTFPVLRNQLIGEMAMLAIIKYEQRDRLVTNKVTKQLEKIPNGVKRDGSPKFKQELVVHCLAMPGTNMEYKIGDVYRCPQPGERVRLILKGLSFGKWIEARKTHRGGQDLNVGDVVLTGTNQAQAYDQDGNSKGQPITDQQEALKVPRGQTLGFYGPIELAEPTDPQWVTAAEEAFLADQRAEQAARAIPADTTPAASRSYLDDEDIPY